MAEQRVPDNRGLEGIVVADTRLSRVDGLRGQLQLCGHDIASLAMEHSIEEVCALLWTGRLPTPAQRACLAKEMAKGRQDAYRRLPQLGDMANSPNGMATLRTSVSHCQMYDTMSPAELMGAMATFTATWWRMQANLEPIEPDLQLDLATDYLRMVHGALRDKADSRALHAYWVTVADHGMNASTFAARVVASTGADTIAAIVAAIAALEGPLHGGAPGPVLDMLRAVGHLERADQWLDEHVAAGNRIMGMGHRVYRVRDPRARVLELATERCLAERSSQDSGDLLALARAVEQCAAEKLRKRHPARSLCANVEFYTAVLLDCIGLDPRLFSPTFAIARAAGWCAHVAEQRQSGRLMRPKARYIGPREPSTPAVQPASA